MASFRRLDSLELGLGFEVEPPKNPPLNDVIRPLVRPSRLDWRKLAKALQERGNRGSGSKFWREIRIVEKNCGSVSDISIKRIKSHLFLLIIIQN